MVSYSVLVGFALCVGQAAAALKSRRVPALPVFEPLNLSSKCTRADKKAKDIDVLLYGVTGFTGKQAALYIADNVAFEHPNFRWAIAGRDKAKLENVKKLASQYVRKPPKQLVFGLETEAEVLQMVQRARAVVNFAGPFEVNHAEAVIRAALQGCTHYVDITEEIHWKAKMIHRYGEQASKRGVAVVQSAGFRSMASEMLAMSAAMDAQKAQKAPPTDVTVVWTTLNGAPSGGQRATTNYARAHYPKSQNPYMLVPEIPEDMKVDTKMDGMTNYTSASGKPLSMDPKASLDCAHIRRAMLAGFPASPISVRQAFVGPQVESARRKFLAAPIDTTKHPERRVNNNPTPGQGPPFWVMRRGSFEGYAVAKGKQTGGTNAANATKETRVTMKGHGDPFFMGSARMATEVGIGLALIGTGGRFGFLTPTAALGMQRLERRLEQLDQGTWLRIYHEAKE